jgi:hypothetical protein
MWMHEEAKLDYQKNLDLLKQAQHLVCCLGSLA